MIKYNRKIIRTKILLVQFLYAYYMNSTVLKFYDLESILTKNNTNKIFFFILRDFFVGITSKDTVINNILISHFDFININSLLTNIILKILIFELYFSVCFHIRNVSIDILVLLKKFATHYDYIGIKRQMVKVFYAYRFVKLLV